MTNPMNIFIKGTEEEKAFSKAQYDYGQSYYDIQIGNNPEPTTVECFDWIVAHCATINAQVDIAKEILEKKGTSLTADDVEVILTLLSWK